MHSNNSNGITNKTKGEMILPFVFSFVFCTMVNYLTLL